MNFHLKPSVKVMLFLLLAAALILQKKDEATGEYSLNLWRGEITTVTASGAMISTLSGSRWVASQSLSSTALKGDSLLILGAGGGRFITPFAIRLKESSSPLRKIRGGFMALLLRNITDNDARGLAGGLLMGLRGMITRNTSEAFRNSGTSHLLALSGLHTAIAAGIMLLVSRLIFGRRPLSALLATGGIICFVLLSGARPSTVRAGIMSSWVILRMHYRGGETDILGAWWIALGLSLMILPETLSDKGAWMSYGAVLSLILLGRNFRGRTAFLLNPFFAGITITAALAPLITSVYGGFAWLGPTATVFSLPLVITVMFLGVAAALGIPLAESALTAVSSLWHGILGCFSHSPLAVEWDMLWPMWAAALLILRIFSRWNGFHRRFR